MAEAMVTLNSAFSKYMTGFALSSAILEDYVKVVAKIEGVSDSVVSNRIQKRAQEIYEEAMAPIRKANQDLDKQGV